MTMTTMIAMITILVMDNVHWTYIGHTLDIHELYIGPWQCIDIVMIIKQTNTNQNATIVIFCVHIVDGCQWLKKWQRIWYYGKEGVWMSNEDWKSDLRWRQSFKLIFLTKERKMRLTSRRSLIRLTSTRMLHHCIVVQHCFPYLSFGISLCWWVRNRKRSHKIKDGGQQEIMDRFSSAAFLTGVLYASPEKYEYIRPHLLNAPTLCFLRTTLSIQCFPLQLVWWHLHQQCRLRLMTSWCQTLSQRGTPLLDTGFTSMVQQCRHSTKHHSRFLHDVMTSIPAPAETSPAWFFNISGSGSGSPIKCQE